MKLKFLLQFFKTILFKFFKKILHFFLILKELKEIKLFQFIINLIIN